ncbi:hypothetical protein C8J57DRAFT_1624548 [Mycena rebaudengoi]|nr:hypothetical protein C8J57DRAFT_1624548 [Mycena rebaudengoi]
MPTLHDIPEDDDGSEDDREYEDLPDLQAVPADEITDDEDLNSDDEEDRLPRSSPFSFRATSSEPEDDYDVSSPLSAAHSSDEEGVRLPRQPVAAPVVASSSPMYTPRTERKVVTQMITDKRLATRENNRVAEDREKQEAEELAREEIHVAEERKAEHFRSILDGLQAKNYSLADFVEGAGTSPGARTFVWDWAYGLVKALVAKESRKITASGMLNKSKKTVNEDFFLKYSLTGLSRKLRELSPLAFGIFDAFSSTARQRKENSKLFQKKRDVLAGSAALSLLNGASQNNSYAQAVVGTYLMATGAQRQHFSVLQGFGISMGYASIITRGQTAKETDTKANETDLRDDSGIDGVDPRTPGKHAKKNKRARESKKKKKKRKRSPGTLSLLSDACRATARALAATGLYLIVYDNINMMVRIAEQILGRKNTQENGTCATEVPLHDAKLEDLLTSELDKSISAAPPLTIENLEFTEAEGSFFRENMIHTILRIIIRYGGEGLEIWKDELDAAQPRCTYHPLHPLPAMEIDENSTKGNIEVNQAINAELGLDENDPEYVKYVKIIAGDQLTIARQRSILQIRLGHESGTQAWKHIVLMPGLFHAKIADCHGVLHTHFGKPGAGTRSPGSLGFHNTVLDRLPITLTSLPPFRTCRDLIMVSLYARILHCLLLVSKQSSLEDYAKTKTTWATLTAHAEQIYDKFADADRVQELRERRVPDECKRDAELAAKTKGKKASTDTSPGGKKENPPHIQKGDMVFENAVLFISDALLTREFADAIKAGDSGRIVLILKQFAFTYRANGRTKYAHEMLHINAFVEVDLVQEHLNLWIKRIYKADGDAHSWDWLALVSPCVDVLRRLATSINADLGSRQGNKHTIPDLEDDIFLLMASLQEHEVYIIKEGRTLDDDEMPAPDVLSAGAAALTHGTTNNPLDDFNAQFDQIRRRRDLLPVSALAQYLPGGAAYQAEVSAPAPTSLGSPAASDGLPDVVLHLRDTGTVASAGDEDDSQAPPPQTPPASDDEDDEEEEELLSHSPTLTRHEPEDVDLDMDNDWYLDAESASESDSEDGGSSVGDSGGSDSE